MPLHMRRAFIITSALVIVASSALVLWVPRRGEPPLTIVLVRHLPVNDSQEKFTLAVTNNTARTLEGYIAEGPQLLGGSTFRLNSHSGAFVDTYSLRHGPWIFGGTYRRSMSNAEAKIRLFLSEHTSLRERALRAYKPIRAVRFDE